MLFLVAFACFGKAVEDEPARCSAWVLVTNTALSQVTGASLGGKRGNSSYCALFSGRSGSACDLRKCGSLVESLFSSI